MEMVLHLATYIDRCNCKTPSEKVPPKVDLIDIGTGIIVTYYYGFLFSIIVNSAIWTFISFIVNKYYWKSTGFKDEKYLMHYAVSKLNSR
ncbi:MAG: hypothetical protein K0R16_8 [Nitrososphaeraceae archaeon]|nr:hypothetical protein [Nitrososphaeraceae archaeon]